MKVLSEIDKRILSTLDRDEMMGGAISQIRRVAPADVASVILLDEEAAILRFCYGWCLNIKIGDVITYDQCPGYQTLNTGKTLARKNLTEETVLTEMDKTLLEGGIKSDVFIPIIAKGKGVGLLHLGSYRVAGFTFEDIRTIENLANQLGIALENSRLLSDLEEMFISVVTALASAIDAKSPWTKGHSERVTRYALMLAERMGLSHQETGRAETRRSTPRRRKDWDIRRYPGQAGDAYRKRVRAGEKTPGGRRKHTETDKAVQGDNPDYPAPS